MAQVNAAIAPEDVTVVENANTSESTPERHIRAKGFKQKNTEIKQSNLTQAKDRAQVTATTAMSIVNVALLKAVIDQGPDLNKYYYANLGLIIASLSLQITAGLLSLMVAAIERYYKKNQDDICEDMFEFVCCCHVRTKSKRRSLNISSPGGILGEHAMSTRVSTADDNDPASGCCPFQITSRTFSEYEYEILDTHEQWCSNMVEYELRDMEAETNIKHLSKMVKNIRTRLNVLRQQATDNPSEHGDLADKIADLAADLEKKETEINTNSEKRIHAEIVRGQGELLSTYVDEIRKDHVQKSLSFWQGILNYILYIVFVLNSFVTGLGMANTPNASNGDQGETTTSASF